MEDDLNLFLMEDNLNLFHMEDNLKKINVTKKFNVKTMVVAQNWVR